MQRTTILLMSAAAALILGLFGVGFSAQGSGQQNPSSGTQKTLTGVVSDSMCATTHMLKDKSPAECTRMCVKDGQNYALVVDKNLYTLTGHEAELDKLAGQTVTVQGALSGNTLKVTSVAPAKKGAGG